MESLQCAGYKEFGLLNAVLLMLRSVITALETGTREESEVIVSDKGW